MGCALYETLGLDCWSGPRCGDCPSDDGYDDYCDCGMVLIGPHEGDKWCPGCTPGAPPSKLRNTNREES